MKTLFASLFAALFALATASAIASPVKAAGIVVSSADGDEEKGESKSPTTEQKEGETDKEKDADDKK